MPDKNKTYVKLRDRGSVWVSFAQRKSVKGDLIVELETSQEVNAAIIAQALVRVEEKDYKAQQAAMKKAVDGAEAEEPKSQAQLDAEAEASAEAAKESGEKAKEVPLDPTKDDPKTAKGASAQKNPS